MFNGLRLLLPVTLYTKLHRIRRYRSSVIKSGKERDTSTDYRTSQGHLQVFSPLVTLGNPLFQLLGIAGGEPNLEWLGLCSQGRRDSIALNGIQDRPITLFLGGLHVESCDQPQESRVELAVGKMRASTHTGAGPISVVWSSRSFTQLKISLRDEFVGFFEMVLVIVGGPGILVAG